jgi:hypothetical protein
MEEAKARAAFLEGQTLFSQGKYDDAYKAIGDLLANMNRDGPFSEQVKAILSEKPMKKDPEPGPKKEPDKKEPPKKEPEKKELPKKEPEKKEPPKEEPKNEPGDMPEVKDEDAQQKDQIKKLADGVDKYRRDLIVLALKIRVKKGEAEKGIEQLDLLKKFGGSIEANISTLEQITAEMALQIGSLKRTNPMEAKALSEGFGKLLDKLSAEPNLPTSVQRFLGQSLILVGEFDKAIDALNKVPAPADRATIFRPQDVADPAVRRAALEYRRAQLELLRAYRQAGKFDKADAILADAMGAVGKPGWAANSIDFRKEKAYLFEAKGFAAQGAMAKPPFAEAIKEWTSLVTVYRNQVVAGQPQGPGGGNLYLASKNNYYEMLLYHQRCLVKANRKLLPPGDAKLAKMYDDTAKRLVDLEMVSGHDFSAENRELYHDFLFEIPELKTAYEKALRETLPTAESKAAERDKEVADLRTRQNLMLVKWQLQKDEKAEEVPPFTKAFPALVGAPAEQLGHMRRGIFEDRAKLLAEDATWIREWAKKGGKFFLDRPMASATGGGM